MHRTRDSGWEFHRTTPDAAEALAKELAPALRNLDGGDAAAEIRRQVVAGIFRERLLRRITQHLEGGPEASERLYLRYTRRGWQELQGRRHSVQRRAQYES